MWGWFTDIFRDSPYRFRYGRGNTTIHGTRVDNELELIIRQNNNGRVTNLTIRVDNDSAEKISDWIFRTSPIRKATNVVQLHKLIPVSDTSRNTEAVPTGAGSTLE